MQTLVRPIRLDVVWLMGPFRFMQPVKSSVTLAFSKFVSF